MYKRKEMIKTSVIIPMYNTANYIEECLNSVLQQSQKDIEIIIVDDGSTDNGLEIVTQYVNYYSNIRVISQSNQKPGAARNHGLQEAMGEYIYFLDSDDYINTITFELCYNKCKAANLDFILFDSRIINSEGNNQDFDMGRYDRSQLDIDLNIIYSGKEYWEKFYHKKGIFFSPCLVYIKRSYLLENHIYFLQGVYYEDNLWTAKLYQYAKRIQYMPKKLYNRRYRSVSIMTSEYSQWHLYSCIVLANETIYTIHESDEEDKTIILINLLLHLLKFMQHIIKQIDLIYETRIDDEIIKLYNCHNIFYYFGEEKIAICILLIRIYQCYKRKVKYIDREESYLVESALNKMDDILNKELKSFFGSIPLNKMDKTIGIYGTGKISKFFLEFYQSHMENIYANIFFIDTYKESGNDYLGHPLYNIKDVSAKNLDMCVIASIKYEEEMIDEINRIYDSSINLYLLPYWFHYLLK